MASFFKRSNGIYYTAYREKGRSRWISLGTKDLEKARELFASLAPHLDRPRRTNLSGFMQRIEQYSLANLSIGTGSLYTRAFKHLLETLGNLPLRAITPLDIEQFKQARLRKASPVTVNINLRTLRAAFQLAVDWRLIDENPARKCKLLRVPAKDPCFLTLKEFIKLCSVVEDVGFRRLLLFGASTGMRRGELVNLCWEDLDFDRRSIRIRNRCNFVVKGYKPRTIPMSADIYNIFMPLRKPTGYVFSDKQQAPLSAHAISRRFKSLVRKCELPEQLHFHSLRHSYASWMLMANVPISVVKELLGHSSVAVTEIYGHLSNEYLRESVGKLQLPDVDKLTN
ncbi:MAG: tyrosine-type recombinase/integrase [Ignavibacteriales bacterium]|nr:tyrosine-type recombinase/integrase [Ignavibacteriales bacterium]